MLDQAFKIFNVSPFYIYQPYFWLKILQVDATIGIHLGINELNRKFAVSVICLSFLVKSDILLGC
jgi:hypothetical protein